MKKKASKERKHSFHPSSLRPHPFVRLFFAVELPSEVRRRAADHIAELQDRMPEVRAGWERPEKMHITLKFIGEVEPEASAVLSDAAERAVHTLAPFHFTIEGAGAFPLRGLPRVLWLGVRDASRSLAQLQKRLEDECEAAGFEREARPFHPHLTIARLRRPEGARKLAALHQEKGFEAAEVFVDALLLIQSELGPAGSRYTELSRHKLGQADLF
ncbi:MAG TPA: RNA 2',3'-cyclic phosphodiesterase [Pyrinomonadaceae bacterium]|jgi:2'-5' RNA ligase|nr:RNA 2',3'-cyclic phosphodiesterase [Pyrinomonadaceae bacterium]